MTDADRDRVDALLARLRLLTIALSGLDVPDTLMAQNALNELEKTTRDAERFVKRLGGTWE